MTKEAKTTRKPRRKTVVLSEVAAQEVERVATDLDIPKKTVSEAASLIASDAITHRLARQLGEAKLEDARARVAALERAIGDQPAE